MIDDHKLVWIRAALQYFEEELGPHGAQAMSPYLKSDDWAAPTQAQLQSLRQWLANCRIEYACVDFLQRRFLDRRLFASPEETVIASASHHRPQIAVVLSKGWDVTPPPSAPTG